MARRKDTNLARSTEWSETTCLIFCQPLWCLNVVVVGALMSSCRRFASSVETARKKMVAWNPGSEKLLAPSSSRSHFLSGHARRRKREGLDQSRCASVSNMFARHEVLEVYYRKLIKTFLLHKGV